ncbi:hypothetical protein EVAR_81654_1 [Eumeta japonica]|uniref:Uncharacterized protein n=1 Tax=Eumeta variegata TaxID=151549 RepID=A0A4C1V3E8_EUMVA|nr:hypothetical protein EVAR_81654_1 [Eumeta japonica]
MVLMVYLANGTMNSSIEHFPQYMRYIKHRYATSLRNTNGSSVMNCKVVRKFEVLNGGYSLEAKLILGCPSPEPAESPRRGLPPAIPASAASSDRNVATVTSPPIQKQRLCHEGSVINLFDYRQAVRAGRRATRPPQHAPAARAALHEPHSPY